jgi:hypothetical protein
MGGKGSIGRSAADRWPKVPGWPGAERLHMKILVFTEGTIFTHREWHALSREETVRRVQAGERHAYRGIMPIGNAAEKVRTWKQAGAEIAYLTSRCAPVEIKHVKEALIHYAFPAGELFYRRTGEEYKDVAERVRPDIIVEDDCESIGGEGEMTFPRIRSDMKEKIRSVVVKEFGGIDHLPDDILTLLHGVNKPDSSD